ncbi:bifunctional tryptophan synthase trp1 [Blyttiomyces sp. JEL0837]|nr:bifunctional tryptophan synthase trp1 [Blyttiomyces sp. JEL0837]
MKTILIDNYDSFTWNVYQYLSDVGADVIVFRNDEVTVEDCIALNPRNIVISPGPGHPRDAGISMQVIKAFAGKVPILGVCLGEQCMFDLYGGTVTYAGEIVHGKTSPVSHDGKGLYEGVSQRIECTRYHSLAGDAKTLPACLEITSRTDSGVVMGVRHKEYVMEGVQYHPESIASEEGMKMIRNFLKWEGGTWDKLKIREDLVRSLKEVEERKQKKRSGGAGANGTTGSGIPLDQMSKLNSTAHTAKMGANGKTGGGAPSILKTIEEKRKQDVASVRILPGLSEKDLIRSLALGLAPQQIDFPTRVLASTNNNTTVAVMAEIKRGSPSKGAIDMSAHAPTQALEYANGGAAVISVLTEPTWFKGSLADLAGVRFALDKLPNRPAILRKDFVVDPYQIYEARLAGADTVLLIVAILDDHSLSALMEVSRSLGMEPLVEVANAEEMARAVKSGAKVIGVNNRDLHTFSVDMSRTSDLAGMVPAGTILCALSGITGRADVEKYVASGAHAVLVGEHLMRAADKKAFIQGLRGIATESPGSVQTSVSSGTLVKICGVARVEDALCAARAGADFIGLIFATSPRQVTAEKAKEIATAVRKEFPQAAEPTKVPHVFTQPGSTSTQSWYQSTETTIRSLKSQRNGPLLVGVFSNEHFETINAITDEVGLDLVQFHGNEIPSLHAPLIRRPVIKAFHIHKEDNTSSVTDKIAGGTGVLSVALLDTGVKGLTQQGGSGEKFDWELAASLVNGGIPVWMAGGLDPNSVGDAVKKVKPFCVDVSSGVEASKGVKDHEKVKAFVAAAKGL